MNAMLDYQKILQQRIERVREEQVLFARSVKTIAHLCEFGAD